MIPGIPSAQAVLLTEEMVGQYGSNAGTHTARLACEQACATLSAQQQQSVAPQDVLEPQIEEISTSPARESPVPSSHGQEDEVPDWDPSQPAEYLSSKAHISGGQQILTGTRTK